jgi:hypothetical protein
LATPVFNFVDSGPPTDGDTLTVEDPTNNDNSITNTGTSPGAGVITWGNPVTETINYSGIENLTVVPVAVAPGPATHFRATSSQAATTAGTALNVTVTALDADNNVATAYTGTVHFASTDPYDVLPPHYTFTAADKGTHTFSVILKTAGTQTVTVSGNELPSGAVSAWRGEGNALDSVGSNNGTLHGGVTFTPGEVGHAFNFNGGNGYVSVPDAASLKLISAVTLEAWINPATLAFPNGFGTIVAKSNYPARNYGLWVFHDGSLHLSYVNSSGVNVYIQTAPGLIPVGVFTHVAGVIDTAAGVMQIYVNGQLVASRATAGPLVPNTAPLTIGASDTPLTYFFNGRIDEATVYNRALSAAEIQDIYLSGSAGKFQTDVGSASVKVVAGPATHFRVTSSEGATTVGTALNFTVTALDAENNVATGYTGTIHCTSSGAAATLPADYPFTAADKGEHTFTVIPQAAGTLTIQFADKANPPIGGSATVTVVAAPTIVPNLGGLTMNFGTPGLYTNTLAITSVQNQGGGKGTFVGVYTDSRDGVVTAVSGTIAFKGMAPNPFGLPGYYYDFAVTFSGSATHHHVNPRTGLWSETVDQPSGSGDFDTNAVSADAGIYQQGGVGALPPGSWVYSGTESDSLTYSDSNGGEDIQSESGPVKAYNWYPW